MEFNLWTINVFVIEFRQVMFAEDEAKKAEMMKRIETAVIPLFMKKLNKVAEDSGKFFVGKNITWADLYAGHFLTLLRERTKLPFLDAYPAAKKAVENIFEIPQMKEYIANRVYKE